MIIPRICIPRLPHATANEEVKTAFLRAFGETFEPQIQCTETYDTRRGEKTKCFFITPRTWRNHRWLHRRLQEGQSVYLASMGPDHAVWKCVLAK